MVGWAQVGSASLVPFLLVLAGGFGWAIGNVSAARARAARLVAGIPGVDAVVNHLLVRGEDDQPPDLRLADQSA